MGRKNSKKSYRRDLVDSYISTVQNQIAQEQAQAQAQMQQPDYAKGLTRADVDNYINSFNSSQEIPKLEQNTTPTPSISDELKRMEQAKADTTTPRTEGEQKAIDTYYDSLVKASGSTPTQSTPTTDYKAEIDRMNALKADTTANRTEGENKAIEDYLNGLQEAQAYVDSQKPKTTTQKKTETVEKKKVDTERAQYERQIVKANFDKAHPEVNRMAEARAVGRKALEDAKNGKIVSQRVLSTNEQRDYERAKEAEAKQLRAEKKEVSAPETANENVGDELTVGKIVKPLQNPKDKVQNFLQPLKDLETDPIYDDRGFEINQSRTDKIKKSQEFIDDVNNYNAWRGSQADLSGVNPIATIVKSNISKKLQEKYDLDEETLNELANEIKYEASNQRGQEAVENARDYGEAHPFKGSKKSLWSSVGSALFTPTQMADDIANYVYNGQKASPYEGAHLFSQQKRALREGVKENIGFAPLKGAYDVGMGLADLGVSATAGALGGLPPAVGLALNTANDATTSALERGSNPLIANAYGAISGGADFVLNTIGLDKAKDLAMERITVQGIPKLLKQMGIAGNYEGLENLLQDGVQKATDEILNGGLSYLLGEGYNSEIAVSYKDKIANGESPADAIIDIIKDTAIQEVTSYLTGVGMGAGTQGFNTAVNELYARSFFDDLNKQSERVQEKLRAYKEGRLNPLEQSIAETNNAVDEIPRVEEQLPTRQLPENVEDIPKDVNDYVRTRDNLIAKANEANISGDSAEVNRLVNAVQRMDDYIKANYPEWMNGRFFNRAEYDKLNPTEKVEAPTNKSNKPQSTAQDKVADNGLSTQDYYKRILNDDKFLEEEAERIAYADSVFNGGFEGNVEDIKYELELEAEESLNRRANGVQASSNKPQSTVLEPESQDTNLYKRGVEEGLKNETPEYEQTTLPIENPTEEVPNEPKAPETRERRTINTLKKAGVLTQKDIDRSPELQAVKDYTVKHNIESMANAQEDVDKNAKNLIKEYSSGKRQAKTDEDVDKTMIMLTDKNIKKTRAQKNAMMINLAENGTEGGRFIQAFAKWANTSTDALVKATKLMLDDSKGWASRNTKQKDHNARLAKALAEMGHKPEEVPEKIPPTHEDIKRGAIAELNKEFGSIEEKLNDTDFEFVTSMLENNVPTWQIADEIEHRLKHGEWYPIDESLPLPVEEQSSKLAKILDSVVGGKELVKEKTVKPEESIYDQMKRIRNTIENSEAISFAKDWNDDDYFVIAQMFENNVPNWEIADEIRHRAEHGVWYTRDESTPVKVQKSKQLAKMLNNVVNGNQPKAEKAPKSYSEFLTEIRNTIESEPSSISKIFNDADYYFIGQMMQEGVPQWLMEDELRHKVETGDWFTIDESINAPKPTNQRLKNAFDMLVNEQVRVEPERKSIAQYREEVRNTLNNSEFADMAKNFNDSDVDYLANLMEQGATTKEISDALNMKLATGKWGISEEAQNQVNDLFEMARHYDENSKEFVEAQAEAFRILAEEVAPKASPMEKFDAWRYMAMLGNPKTMLRNYVGNKMFGAVTGASNSFAALLEAGVDKAYYKKTGEHIQRTKALLNPKQDKALIDLCKEDAYGKRYRNIEGSKYEKSTTDAIKQQSNTFDSKVMQLAEKAVDRGISDTKAVVNKYGTSLAGYMKANGMDESFFNDSYRFDELNRKSRMTVLDDAESAEMESLRQKANAMEDARDYALKQAEYATFHEDNAVAEWLADMSRKAPGAGKLIIEGVVPFKKTPANILRSGWEYSPFGAISSLKKTGKLIMENTGKNKGNLADEYSHTNFITGKTKQIQKTLAHEVIDSWSKTLTGSALALFGSYLFDKGALTSTNDGEKYQDQKEGIGNYALNINGHTFTLDWAAPGVMPLLVGAEFKKIANDNAVLNQHWYENPDRMLETINALLDPMFETSMLSGVKDTFQTAANELRYNDEKSKGAGILGTIAANALTGYFAQALPTFSGQIARTVDPIRRTTDTYNEGFLGGVEKQMRKTMNKIPFLSTFNTPYIDASGEYQYNSPFESTNAWGVLGNLGYQTLIPSYYNKKHTTVGDEKAREIYNATYENEDGEEVPIRDSDVFSDWRTTKTINGERLNPKELQEFRTEMGLANEDLKERLAESDWFNDLPYQDQNDIYKSLNTIADNIGQYAVRPDAVKSSKSLKAYIEAGGGEEGIQAIVDQLEAKYNPYGLSESAYKDLKESGEDMSDYEGYAEELSKYGLKDNQYNRQLWKDEEDLSGYEGYAEALEDLGVEGSDKYRNLWLEGDKQAFVEQVRYDKAFKDAGMDESYKTESAKMAYADSQKNPAVLEKYAHYRQWLKQNDIQDSKTNWENYSAGKGNQILQEKQANIAKAEAKEEQKDKWSDYGLNLDSQYFDADASYAKAHDVIPSLSEQQFANTYLKINTNNDTNVTQKEVIAYLNSIDASEKQGEQIWNAYLSKETDSTIPVLTNGTWSTKRKKK